MLHEYDMSWEEEYGERPKTWAFHHRHWTSAAIAEMKASGEWYEDLDAEEDAEEDEEDEQ